MKIKELIGLLSKLPQEENIYYVVEDGGSQLTEIENVRHAFVREDLVLDNSYAEYCMKHRLKFDKAYIIE